MNHNTCHPYLKCCLLLILFLLPVIALAEEIRIGAILPLSGSAALYGDKPRKGIELAVRDFVNRVHPQNTFKVIFEDDSCDAKSAVSAYQKLTKQEGVKIILGPSCSAASAAVAPLAQRDGVFAAYYSEARSVPIGDSAVRLWIPNNRQGEKLAKYIWQMGVKTLAILHVDNPYGRDFTDSLTGRYSELGGKIIYNQSYSPDTRDFTFLLLQVKHKAPYGLVLGSYVGDSTILVKQLSNLSLKMKLFGTSLMDDPDFLQSAVTVDGLHIVEVPDNVPQAFRVRWTEEFKENWPGMASGGSIFYDFVSMLLAELNSSEKLSAVELKKRLLSSPYAGIAGPFGFDSEGNLTLQHSLMRLEKGQFGIDPQN